MALPAYPSTRPGDAYRAFRAARVRATRSNPRNLDHWGRVIQPLEPICARDAARAILGVWDRTPEGADLIIREVREFAGQTARVFERLSEVRRALRRCDRTYTVEVRGEGDSHSHRAVPRRKSHDDELTTVTIAGHEPARGWKIPAPPADDPLHDQPRAGFVGDYRPLDCRLADPHTPKTEG